MEAEYGEIRTVYQENDNIRKPMGNETKVQQTRRRIWVDT